MNAQAPRNGAANSGYAGAKVTINSNKRRGRRSNGSKRSRAKRKANRNRWAESGIAVGSVNIAGVSYFKVLLLLDLHALDVLCLQETWLVGQNKQELDIPGYTTLEQRREKGKRGGIAILVRNSLKVLQHTGN